MGRLRIISGSLKGRRIVAPGIPGVRPTSEKVREALFSILGAAVEGASVLDAFAGSGAIGCEALSRGARVVVFLESDPRVAHVLRDNVRAISAEERVRVLRCDATVRVSALATWAPFDLIVADPPYGSGSAVGAFLSRVRDDRLLGPGGVLVVECAARDGAPEGPPGLERFRGETYGDTRLDFYRVA